MAFVYTPLKGQDEVFLDFTGRAIMRLILNDVEIKDNCFSAHRIHLKVRFALPARTRANMIVLCLVGIGWKAGKSKKC